jgi:hypothetical protein
MLSIITWYSTKEIMTAASIDAYLVPLLAKTLAGCLVTLTPFLVNFLLSKGAALNTSAQKDVEDRRKNLLDRLESFILIEAGNIVERQFPIIAGQIKTGQITKPTQIRQKLGELGVNLKADAVGYFDEQDIDIVSEVGTTKINQLIEAAANKVSPFPGMTTSNKMLLVPVADALVNQGTAFVKQNIFSLTNQPATPPVAPIFSNAA